MRKCTQMDNAHAPLPRADNSWIQDNDGLTYKQKADLAHERQLSFRRSLEDSFRSERLNKSLSIQRDASIHIPAGIDT
jgi:hypothetical protein